MFSDLVGSTALSARMDPEDLREVISACQKFVAETVGRFGGFVAKYTGDGVLVYFGYPKAHEHDAERALRAGLELIAAVSDLRRHGSSNGPTAKTICAVAKAQSLPFCDGWRCHKAFWRTKVCAMMISASR
jgi:class 3 adenylate cyclase